MGLVCGTPTRSMPAAAAADTARTAQAMTITPALDPGVKNRCILWIAKMQRKHIARNFMFKWTMPLNVEKMHKM